MSIGFFGGGQRYEAHLGGKLQDYEYPAAKVDEALAQVPKVKA